MALYSNWNKKPRRLHGTPAYWARYCIFGGLMLFSATFTYAISFTDIYKKEIDERCEQMLRQDIFETNTQSAFLSTEKMRKLKEDAEKRKLLY